MVQDFYLEKLRACAMAPLSISAYARPMLLEKYVIVADMATTTSMAATLQGVRLARAHHMVPSQEHAAVTLNTGTVTAKTTSLVESAINAEMVTMH